jgi:hypothetical protein
MLKYLIAVLFLIACDPGDDAWNGKAPGAPDCLSAPDHPALDCEDEEAGEEVPESAKHVGGTHRAYPVQTGGYWYEGPSWDAKWWKYAGYNKISIFANITPYGQAPKTWSVTQIRYSFCYSGLGPNTVLAPDSATLCTPGHCADVSNAGGTGGSCRGGFASLPMTIPAGGYSHVELLINMHDWWQPDPMTSVSMGSSMFIDYTD